MKKPSTLPLLLGCLFCAAAVRATTISGRVTVANTGLPAGNVTVIITDSTVYFRDSAITNAAGMYSYILPSAIAVGHGVYLTVRDPNPGVLGSSIEPVFHYPGANVNIDLQTVRGTTNGILTFAIYLPISGTVSERLMQCYLVKKAYDPIIADTVLTAVDSFATAGIGGYRFVDSTLYATNSLLLKATLQPADPQYSSTIPTYFDSVAQWSAARVLPAATPSFNSLYISMKVGISPGGPGFIGGSVLLGANKSTGAGDPLAKRIIILTNAATGKAVGYTYSDAMGHFQFSNLAYGNYKVFGDVWSKKNPALTVTVSSSNSSVSNVLFKENRKDFTGQIGGLSVAGENALLAGISAYPNPAKDYVEITGLSHVSGAKTITLSAVNGALITRQTVAAGQAARIATLSLASGIYILRVQTESGSATLEIMK